ncbi:hypothetical protein ACAG25_14905 [Mycobacterium sp. pV006]|uniref:hypothetical protein n=1 Tax=Mycobacterium sp. pV006 TaxID=3238983 RepID=UPI00351B7146
MAPPPCLLRYLRLLRRAFPERLWSVRPAPPEPRAPRLPAPQSPRPPETRHLAVESVPVVTPPAQVRPVPPWRARQVRFLRPVPRLSARPEPSHLLRAHRSRLPPVMSLRLRRRLLVCRLRVRLVV